MTDDQLADYSEQALAILTSISESLRIIAHAVEQAAEEER